MPRVAFFSPWPPQPSGVAACAADLVPRLAEAGHAIDVFVDEALVPVSRGDDRGPTAGHVRVLGAHDFVWRQALGHYDLPIYQLGNSWAHGFIWPYLFRWPGLTVLHDARLHHARASALMARRRLQDYRAEFRYNHPDVSPDAAELAVAGFDGTYYYHWPMRRAVVEASRMVVSHSWSMADLLTKAHPSRPIAYLHLGHGEAVPPDVLATRRARFRAAHGIPDDAMVFGVLGAAAPEKRIGPVLRAFAATRQWAPDARLIIAGHVAPLLGLDDLLDNFGVRSSTHVVGRVTDEEFDDAVAASDVGINLRWPTAREVSGPWLRFIAAGRPTVIVDAVHTVDLLTLDPRTWRCHVPTPTLNPDPEREAVAVAIDILDEDHSLRLALRRLASDEQLRAQLGANAQRHWQSSHSVARMVRDYNLVITEALHAEIPKAHLPMHLRPNPEAHSQRLMESILGMAR